MSNGKMVLVLAVLMCGCATPAIETRPSDNTAINVDLLVTIDGCKVYRFSDEGWSRYVTICPDGRRTSTDESWTQSTGKSSIRHQSVIDSVRKP